MIERTEFIKKGEEILDFVDAYGVMKYEYLDKFFPGSKKIVGYLIKKRRLHISPDGIYIGASLDFPTEKCLTAALGVLADIFEKVQSHARAATPAQISFITYTGDYYEIIYVGYGMEALAAASFETQTAAKQQAKTYTETIKRIVIVEDKSQMERLRLPGIVRFVLAHPDGSLSYFKGS